ncbi:hypothetical protein M441DRAFT_54434 [Trichoderma asperellum CBS 433.97]|uniref:Uncharacterized protein n=1 Tax=Trichoderma asperellum (strain ATCC 204424 / CBS 433.97 / NBRC 101777) TaxID=1042311 RepID=A0A2T3ZKP0_TRIA4|nr:hypothetical protein M441DRAFT_54434 [Trichoderma asperellum CBS 433.97]PTB45374.1 hypothetical protein M441DRAFT_54434 [Trichoderma asperellum CBS 433.97]
MPRNKHASSPLFLHLLPTPPCTLIAKHVLNSHLDISLTHGKSHYASTCSKQRINSRYRPSV